MSNTQQRHMAPTIEQLIENKKQISGWINETPVWPVRCENLKKKIGDIDLTLKLELWQMTGSFKARGALTTLLHLDPAVRANGVVAASAGNHAIGVSYAAKCFGTTAKVVMPKAASPIRRERCQQYGAEVVLVDTMADALSLMSQIAEKESRYPVHPFEGFYIALGTGTIGYEITQQVSQCDAIVVPIGGGGLIAGIAAAVKQISPQCQIYGVEPFGADSVYRSLQVGKPMAIGKVDTIADSLGAPYATPYTFSLCQQFVDEVVRISDDDMRRAMVQYFYEMKLAVEPAGSAALAAIVGPLREKLQGKKVVAMISGTNVDVERYYDLVKEVL